MKLCTYILFAILFFSCSSENNNFVGSYEIFKPNKLERYKNYLTGLGRISGTTLTLYKDSTFNMTNCSMNYIGKWSTKKDSLLLFPNTKKWLIDSLNYDKEWKKNLGITNKPYTYKIQKESLIQIHTFTDGSKSIEKLVKN